jgi:hypothetical protein
MKTAFLVGVTAATLVMAVGAASAQPVPTSISITDLTDGTPTVVVNGAIFVTSTTSAPEQVTITGNQTAGPNPLSVPGTRSVILLEPAADLFGPRMSDFVTFTASEPIFGPPVFQMVTVLFESDGAATFLSDVAALPPTTPTLLEDGTPQDVTALLNSSPIVITVQSDLASLEQPVPEPSTLALLGLGGLGLAGYAYRRGKQTL